MTRNTSLLGLLLGSSLVLTGCFDNDATPRQDSDTMDESDGSDMGDEQGDQGPGSGPTDNPGTTGTTGEDPTDTDEDPSDTDEDPTAGATDWNFDDSPPEEYAQIDRMGMPAINSVVISASDKDIYNRSTPADDAAGMFVAQIVDNVVGLHGALDDDLVDAGLVPCDGETCVAQAAPLVVPDTLKIDLNAGAGFPNGRLPTDPVIDVTLAVVLLDLGVEGQNALSLVGVNPTANDVEFSDEFPYFARPHE